MENVILDILEEITNEEIIRYNIDINLRDEGIMDSMDFVVLLLKIEEKLGIIISPSEYRVEDMDTPTKIIEIVMNKRKGNYGH